jgi:RNA polymerase primary sigma factor
MQNEVTAYLQSIAKIPLLNRQDELKHGKDMVEGRKELVELICIPENLPLIRSVIENSALDEEECNVMLALVDNCFSPEKLEQLKQYMIHIDLDILIKCSESKLELRPIIQKIGKARDILITSNLKLVVSLAKLYVNPNNYVMQFIDLISEGNIGLIKAVDKFDPFRESKLGTLATWWIRQAIIRSLSNKSRLIRVPVHMIDALSKTYKQLQEELRRIPTPEEMQKKLNFVTMSLAEIKEIMDVFVGVISLSTPSLGAPDTNNTIESTLGDPAPRVDDILAEKSVKDFILKHLQILSPREEKILRLKLSM